MKKIIKKIESFLDRKIQYIQLIGIALAITSIWMAYYINSSNTTVDYNKRKSIIDAENRYNATIINKYLKAMEDGKFDNTVFLEKFSTEAYRQNWDIIYSLSENCIYNYYRFLDKIEGINTIAESTITLYNQIPTLSENQIDKSKSMKESWYDDLKRNILELKDLFITLNQCTILSK